MLRFKSSSAIAPLVLALVAGLNAQQLSDGTVYAGQPGAMGFNGDGGKATSAELFGPQGVAVDSMGNLYIADLANLRVRKVAAGTAIITTFAGNGQANYALDNGDGQPATSVGITEPVGVAVDGSDNVYIFSLGILVQKVAVATGIISTVVPNSVLTNFRGALDIAQESGIGMAVDPTGSTVWLAALGQVLKIDVASGKVATFPTGSSEYYALALAPNGDLIFL
jgi:NHL repeat